MKKAKIKEKYRFTTKPTGLKLADYQQIAFIPMEMIPTDRLFCFDFIFKSPDAVTSGTYFEEGDLLVSKITPCFENGKQGIAKNIPNGFGVATTEVIPIKAIPNESSLAYLAYCLLDRETRHELAEKMEGATGRQRLPKSILQDWEIFFPPFPEQEAIASVLSTIQSAIELQDRTISTIKELRATSLITFFSKGLLKEKTKETTFGAIPESWEIVTLNDVALIERGKFAHRPRNEPRFYGGDIPFIQTGDVTKSNGRIRTFTQTLNKEGLEISRLFPKGTIVLTIAANIADTGILEFDSAFPDSLVGLTPNSTVDTTYLEYYLRTQKPEMDRLAPKGTQKNINIQFLKPWPVLRPKMSEQKEIAKALRSIDDRFELAIQKKSLLKELLFKALYRLMTGVLRVSEALEYLNKEVPNV